MESQNRDAPRCEVCGGSVEKLRGSAVVSGVRHNACAAKVSDGTTPTIRDSCLSILDEVIIGRYSYSHNIDFSFDPNF